VGFGACLVRLAATTTYMSLADLTVESVLKAVREYDEIGGPEFLRRYGFRSSRNYFSNLSGRRYDSKAIAGVAHRFAVPGAEPLKASEFSGGEVTVAHALERLGFTIERPAAVQATLPEMVVGRSYSWNELGEAFDSRRRILGVSAGWCLARR
jgi:hypothetical protein